MKPVQLAITGDGSHTLFVPELNEHYHSSYGAITESLHVFRRAGLDLFLKQKRVSVFEVGFGTGLNALLTSIAAVEENVTIQYYALEKYPVDTALITQLNYAAQFPAVHSLQSRFISMHDAPWEENITLHPNFKLFKIKADLELFTPDFHYDLIYFDAFSPEKQPGMWTPEIFRKLYNNLNRNGALTTYCVKGSVKRMLQQAGFILEKLPGPPGKREILRGFKN